jgi:hypothetical protein
MMSTARILKWITGSFEALLGIPFFGGVIIMSWFYVPLMIMLILHIATLIISVKQEETKSGSILGIVTSVVGVIPIVGMVMHIITAILLMVDASKRKSKTYNMQGSIHFKEGE